MPKLKEEAIKVRITAELKSKVVSAAQARGETESLIVREALTEYFAARPPVKLQTPEAATAALKAKIAKLAKQKSGGVQSN